MTVPILAASGNPLLVYNLTFLGTVFLAAVGMYLLALHVTRNRGAALLAGLFYAFSPYQFGHIPQVQLLSIGWLPLTLLYLERFWAKGRRHDGLLLALFMAAQTLSAFYFGFQVVLVVGLYVLVRLLLQPKQPTWRRLGQILPWLALAALLILPFALPYLRVRAELGVRTLARRSHAFRVKPGGILPPTPRQPDLSGGIALAGSGRRQPLSRCDRRPAGRAGPHRLAEGSSCASQPDLPDRVGAGSLDPGAGPASEADRRPSDRYQPAVRLAVRTRPRHDGDPRAGALQRDALPGPRCSPLRPAPPGCLAG